MANVISNPSFETSASWSFNAQAARTTDAANTGSYSVGLLVLPAGGFGGWNVGSAIQSFPTTSGIDYAITLYANGDLGEDTGLNVLVDPTGTGTAYDALGPLTIPGGAGWHFIEVGTFQAAASTALIEITPVSGTEIALWYVDDVSVEAVTTVAISKAIRSAIVSDLNAIDGSGDFVSTLASVNREPQDWRTIATPGVFITGGSGSRPGRTDMEAFSPNEGVTENEFQLQLVVKSTTPNQDTDDLLDDIRNAVERNASNLYGVNTSNYKVSEVACDWSELEPLDQDDDYYFRGVVVKVKYYYKRGSA